MAEPSPQPEPSLLPHIQSRDIFVGRQREMADLTASLDDALSGHGRLFMLVGEPGIGKTRITQELASYAENRGFQVFWGRCYEDEGAPTPWRSPSSTTLRTSSSNSLAAGPENRS